MKPDSCAEITDAKRVEMKSGLKEAGGLRDSGFVIPAFILIGLGVGLLVDHVGSGFLIGLGLGFVGAELFSFFRKPRECGISLAGGVNVATLLFGTFLVLTGISFIFAPAAAIWPYAIAGLLILSGVWFLARGFSQS